MQALREVVGKIIIALFANILVSVGVVYFIVGSFQNALDTTSNAIQGQIVLVAGQVSETRDDVASLSQSNSELLQGIVRLEQAITDVVAEQERAVDQFAQDTRALAASTDFLIERANRIVEGVVPRAPRDLGTMKEGDSRFVQTDGNGLIAITFDVQEVAPIRVGLAQELGEPSLARVALYQASDSTGNTFSRQTDSLFGIGGLAPSLFSTEGAGPGRYLVIVESLPNIRFSIELVASF